jgi:hypothetical protein
VVPGIFIGCRGFPPGSWVVPFEPMAKEKRTAEQLREEVLQSVNIGRFALTVKRSLIGGWVANVWDDNVVLAPQQLANAQMRVNQIVAELRAKYELAD